MLLALLPLLAVAQSEPRIDWAGRQVARTAVEDTLLYLAMEGDVAGAESEFSAMAYGDANRQQFLFGDPSRADALYWLGRLRREQGDIRGARSALIDGSSRFPDRGRFLAVIRDMELEQNAIRTLPVLWDFEASAHGFVHPYSRDDRGRFGPQAHGEGNRALQWETKLDQRAGEQLGDQLQVGLDLGAPPVMFAFYYEPEEHDAWLKVKLVDDLGRSWVWPEHLQIPADKSSAVVLRVADFVPPTQDASLAEAGLHQFVLEDVTSLHSDAHGWGRVWLDEFQVR